MREYDLSAQGMIQSYVERNIWSDVLGYAIVQSHCQWRQIKLDYGIVHDVPCLPDWDLDEIWVATVRALIYGADKAGSKGSYIWSKMARIMCRSTIPHPRAMSTRMNVKYSNTFGGARKMVASLLTWTGDAWRMLTKIRPFGTSLLSLRWMAQWQCFAFSC